MAIHPLSWRILDSGYPPRQGSSPRFGMVRASVRPRSPQSPGLICTRGKQSARPGPLPASHEQVGKALIAEWVPTFTGQVGIVGIPIQCSLESGKFVCSPIPRK